jgi:hypothetical protein
MIRRTGRSVIPSWEPISVAVMRGWVATRTNTAPWLDRKPQDGMISIVLRCLKNIETHDTINHATKSMLPKAGLYHIKNPLDDEEPTRADYLCSCWGEGYAVAILAKRSTQEAIGSTSKDPHSVVPSRAPDYG